ncbi:hypothetical protein [Nocardia sp. NBC_00511]|uniref:hypothetical protein n=1 Tax=Nocardia sp. NBC_00511 TaxID=2903591 RepID=UPI0030E39A53
MEFYGPRLARLEDCHIRDNDIEMTAAEALEAMVIHRDCCPDQCSRQAAASRIITVEDDKYEGRDRSNVILFPTRAFRMVDDVGCDP